MVSAFVVKMFRDASSNSANKLYGIYLFHFVLLGHHNGSLWELKHEQAKHLRARERQNEARVADSIMCIFISSFSCKSLFKLCTRKNEITKSLLRFLAIWFLRLRVFSSWSGARERGNEMAVMGFHIFIIVTFNDAGMVMSIIL